MGKITTAAFEPGSTTANVYGLWQYDYGQTLRIQGLHLPSMVEIHFSLQETGGTSVSRVGVTKDGVTDVVIPDSMLENDGATRNYDMFAFVYLTDGTSGQTEYKIKLQVKSRPKPEVFSGEENPNIFHEAVQAVRKSADKAAESEKQAEGWAHGRADLPERAQDNAKYYAGQTAADAKKTGTDRKEVERLVESVAVIDEQVVKVENLTKQAQTSATNAALSEQAAKTAETNAQTAQAGAETAEGNAELAEQGAKASEQAVERAKQLVTQMGQEVLDNKNHVDQTVQAFTLTAQQAAADVNNAGQTQTERVQSTGNSAVESVKTAQTAATQAVETAKTEAVKAVQTEGTTQTGNVSAEGEKQVQAVQAAAQEIVADREQIAQNKAGNEGLKQGKADAIVETTSGENIQIEDSSGLGVEGLRVFGKSVQDGVPTPDNPVPISNMGDKGNVKFEITGKNLWQFEESYSSEVGKMVEFVKDGTPFILPAGTYTFSCEGSFGNTDAPLFLTLEDKTKIQAFRILHNEKNFKKTFTIAKKAISVEFVSNATFDTNGTIYNIQLERNSVASSYTPYTPVQSLALATPNGLPGIKVDSGGNYTDEDGQQWICDVICEKDGVIGIEKNVYPKHYTQSDYRYNNAETGFKLYTYDDNEKYVINEQAEAICDVFAFGKQTKDNYTFRAVAGGIRAMVNGATSLDDLKRLLPDGFDVLFVRNTSIFEPFPEDIQNAYKALYTNYPTTIISNDESAHMEVSYVADTKNYIVSKIETSLQKQITDLQNALISQKISGGGIKVTDSARLPIKGFKIFGKSTQVKTNGYQLFDYTSIKSITDNGVIITNNGDGSFTVSGSFDADKYVSTYIEIEHDQLKNFLRPGEITMKVNKRTNPYFNATLIDRRNNSIVIEVENAYRTIATEVITQDMLDNPAIVLRCGLFGTPEKEVTAFTEKVMLYQDGDGTWEPYSGGKSSPSSEWKQEIKNVGDKGDITVTIEGDTEPQSLTLSAPNGLPGIPVDSDSNYTDKDGQQWICDEIDLERGKYVQRIGTNNLKDVIWSDRWDTIPDYHKEGTFLVFTEYFNDKINDPLSYENYLHTNFIRLKNDILKNAEIGMQAGQGTGFNVAFRVPINVAENIEQWIEWLNQNDTVFMYILKSPIEQDLSPEEIAAYKALHTNYPTTTVLNDENTDMELTYTVDTQSYVDTKIAEISKAIL